jgi:hypothetical protein
MELLVLVLAGFAFFVLPVCWIYEMLSESEAWAQYQIPSFLRKLIMLPHTAYKTVEWYATGEWMCKDRWWEKPRDERAPIA